MAKQISHGKVKTYDRHGCRCGECVVAKKVANQSRGNRGSAAGLPVICWCGDRMKVQTKEDVLAGVGVSCGKKTCVDPRENRKVA